MFIFTESLRKTDINLRYTIITRRVSIRCGSFTWRFVTLNGSHTKINTRMVSNHVFFAGMGAFSSRFGIHFFLLPK